MSRVRVWAPLPTSVAVRVDGTDVAMTREDGGWWSGPDLPPGTDYAFVLDGRDPVPDPASRWQPDGVHGPSRVYDQDAYVWQDHAWRGRAFEGAVIYEAHVGTFTPGATLDSAIERLDDLVELGITHVELLPLNDFNGVWNWGYDGVAWYAVHEAYCSGSSPEGSSAGGPDAFKRFVDAAHARGLAVVLDVVYNHLGPSGNYWPQFGPCFKPDRNTWGDLINFDEPAVRAHVIENALMWLRDFHVDALRLDAVHALRDTQPRHILRELSDAVATLRKETGREITLIAESDLNDVQQVIGTEPDGWGLDAQWDDDVHHALHVALTGEAKGYYADFAPFGTLGKVFTRAFLHDGTYSTFRQRDWGRPIDPGTSGGRFVVCLQNHDQVGNRAVGDRLPELTTPGLVKVGAVLLLTSPFIPMLFMGEEWAASTRWPFFTSHPEPELAEATGKGRLEEFADHGWDVSAMIDPQDPRAYHEAILKWDERTEGFHAEVLELYRSLLALRAAEPDLREGDLSQVQVHDDSSSRSIAITRGGFVVLANLGGSPVEFADTGTVVLATGSADAGPTGTRLGPETAAVLRRR